MSDARRFVDACGKNDLDTVRELLDRVDINAVRNERGGTGLGMAMAFKHVAIVKLLLAVEYVDLAVTDGDGWTALHWACCRGSVESARLFLAHPQCTKDIVRMRTNDYGDTAEMIADMFEELPAIEYMMYSRPGQSECAELVREYLDAAVVTVASVNTVPADASPGEVAASLGQLTLGNVEREEDELKSRKEALAAEEVPECPVCIQKMVPPLQIFSCSNGHIICSNCRSGIKENLCVMGCQATYTGRAIAVEEQMASHTLGIM